MLYSDNEGLFKEFEKKTVFKKDSGVITEALCLKPDFFAIFSKFSGETKDDI